MGVLNARLDAYRNALGSVRSSEHVVKHLWLCVHVLALLRTNARDSSRLALELPALMHQRGVARDAVSFSTAARALAGSPALRSGARDSPQRGSRVICP